MPNAEDILKLTCQKLENAHVPYMLTGSLAANFYAAPRMTRDIDMVIEILISQVDQFLHLFKDDFYVEKSAVLEAILRQGMFNIVHNNSIFKVDFIIRKNSSYRQAEFQRRRRAELNDLPVWIVSPEDLIISKLFWAKDSFSELQIKDVRNLLASIKNLDEKYIRKWVQELELQAIDEKVRSNE